jgi:hypothetical protein
MPKLPTEPVQLSPEQIAELNSKLATMRHDINNHLSLVIAAVELIKHKPDMLQRMISTLVEQPGRISQSVTKFSSDFEDAFGIGR